jgi:hypothetical protein
MAWTVTVGGSRYVEIQARGFIRVKLRLRRAAGNVQYLRSCLPKVAVAEGAGGFSVSID